MGQHILRGHIARRAAEGVRAVAIFKHFGEAEVSKFCKPEGGRGPGQQMSSAPRILNDCYTRSCPSMGIHLSYNSGAGRLQIQTNILCTHTTSNKASLESD
eukprot:917461-Pelagomonas_calceolata.AAC.3